MLFLVVFDEELGDLALVEDEHFYYRSKTIELFVDQLVGHLEGDRVVDADQQDSGGLLAVLGCSADLAVGVECTHAMLVIV